jgi:hypothetical protein
MGFISTVKNKNEVKLYVSSDSLSFYNLITVASSCIHDPPPFQSFISLLIKKPY